MKTKMILVLAISMFVISFAKAEEGKKKENPRKYPFMKMDTDKDGRISLAEFEAFSPTRKGVKDCNEMFAKLDLNKDGYISLEEVKRYKFGHKKKRHHLLTLFETLDTNSDNMLDIKEFEKRKEQIEKNRKTRKAERFAQLDSNKDGFITQEEFDAQREKRKKERFKKLDTDGNGYLSIDEFEKMKHSKKYKKCKKSRHKKNQ